jgi:hypothetical protein
MQNFLYHYTDANAFKSIVSQKEFWLTHTDFLNDYNEGNMFYLKLKDVLNDCPEVIKLVDFIEATTESYCLSFSKNGNLLSQWRGYCPSEGGYSIGVSEVATSAFEIIDATQKDIHQKTFDSSLFITFIDCIYSEEEFQDSVIKVSERLKASYKIISSKNNQSLITYLDSGFVSLFESDLDEIIKLLNTDPIWFCGYSGQKMRFKDSSYKEEAEERLFVNVNKGSVEPFYRVKNSVIVPYLKYKFKAQFIKEVIIGPTVDENLSYVGIRHFLLNYYNNYDNLETFIKFSKIPYRNI